MDRDPLCFVWTALTPATRDNGAVQVVRGSHRHGILSHRGHTLTPEQVARLIAPEDIVHMELAAGEAVLVHNWLIHQSGRNTTSSPRRGFSANYIDARTRVLSPKPPLAGPIGTAGQAFPLLWYGCNGPRDGDGAEAAAPAAGSACTAAAAIPGREWWPCEA